MLVLSRKKDESVCIGNDVVIKILSIMGDKVRVGIEAPKHVAVHRNEVFEAIKTGKTRVTKDKDCE